MQRHRQRSGQRGGAVRGLLLAGVGLLAGYAAVVQPAAALPALSPAVATDACDVAGHVTDPDGRPVPNVLVVLEAPGLELTRTTDASGGYRFDGFARFGSDYDPVGGLRGGRLYDARKGPVHLEVTLGDPAGRYQFHYSAVALPDGESPVSLKTQVKVSTTQFELTTQPECTQNVRLGAASGATSGYAVVNPPEPQRWRNLLVMHRAVRASFEFARTTLRFVPGAGEPLRIFPWCVQERLPGVACPGAMPDASGKPPAGKALAAYHYNGGHPYVSVLPEVSDRQASCPDDALMHEVGHAVLTAGYRQGDLGEAHRVPHGGYYENASSNDSWLEGFANFFALGARRSLGRTSPTFVVCGDNGSGSIDLETNLRAWDGGGRYEEYAAAGLLLDLVDGPQDYRSTRVADLTRLTVLDVPGSPRIVLGKVVRHPQDAVAVRVEFLDTGGRAVRSDAAWVDDRTGLFLIVAPEGLEFASVRAVEFAGSLDSLDDDPLHESPDLVWSAIRCGPKGPKGTCAGDPQGVLTMTELYGALRAAFAGDRDRNGVDDVDQVFIDHGFHEDKTGDQGFRQGATLGMTSHPARGTHRGPAPARYSVAMTTALPVRIVSNVPTRAIVMVSYPAARATDSFSYLAQPGPSGLISVVLPPESSQATVSIVALADGRIPRVVATLDPAELWHDRAPPSSRPPLVVQADLRPGTVDPDHGTGTTSTGSAPTAGVASTPGIHDASGTGAVTPAGQDRRSGGRTLATGLRVGAVTLLGTAGLLLALALRQRRTVMLVAAAVVALAASPALAAGMMLGRGHPDGARPSDQGVATSSVAPSSSVAESSVTAADDSVGAKLPVADASASSTLAAQTGAAGTPVRYDARLSVDGKPATAWCTSGDGTGQVLRIRLVGRPLVEAIEILPGYDKIDSGGKDRWSTNRRITRVIYRVGMAAPVSAALDGRRSAQRTVLSGAVATNEVEIRLEATSPGDDTCISEVAIYGTPRGV